MEGARSSAVTYRQENVIQRPCDGLRSESRSEPRARSPRGSESEETKAEKSIPWNAPPCPYCGGLTFPLPSIVFPGAYTADRYDELQSDIYSEIQLEGYDSGKSMLLAGFVCVAGHLVMGLAGRPKFGSGLAVPDSGDRLKLQPAEAVAFLVRFMAGEQVFKAREEGQRYIRSLELKQVMAVEERLTQLKDVWPLDENRSCYKAFEYLYPPDCRIGNITFKVLQTENVPASLLEALRAFVGSGSMTLAECKQVLLEAFQLHFQLHERQEKEKKLSGGSGTTRAIQRGMMRASTPSRPASD